MPSKKKSQWKPAGFFKGNSEPCAIKDYLKMHSSMNITESTALASTYRDICTEERPNEDGQARDNACTGYGTYSKMNKIHSTTPKGKAIPTYFPGSCQNLTTQSRPPAGVYAPVIGRVIPSSVV